MDTADREKMLRALAESRDALLEAAAGVPEAKACIRPVTDRWSVLELVEHVGLVEDAMFALLTNTMKPAAKASDGSREELFWSRVASRDRPIAAPEGVRPKGRFASLDAAKDYFRESRARSIRYVTECRENLRAGTVIHPTVGEITGQELLIILALHPARHVGQIREVRESLGLS